MFINNIFSQRTPHLLNYGIHKTNKLHRQVAEVGQSLSNAAAAANEAATVKISRPALIAYQTTTPKVNQYGQIIEPAKTIEITLVRASDLYGRANNPISDLPYDADSMYRNGILQEGTSSLLARVKPSNEPNYFAFGLSAVDDRKQQMEEILTSTDPGIMALVEAERELIRQGLANSRGIGLSSFNIIHGHDWFSPEDIARSDSAAAAFQERARAGDPDIVEGLLWGRQKSLLPKEDRYFLENYLTQIGDLSAEDFKYAFQAGTVEDYIAKALKGKVKNASIVALELGQLINQAAYDTDNNPMYATMRENNRQWGLKFAREIAEIVFDKPEIEKFLAGLQGFVEEDRIRDWVEYKAEVKNPLADFAEEWQKLNIAF